MRDMVNLYLQRLLRRFGFFILIPSECGCISPIKAKQNKIKQQQNRKNKRLGYDEHHSLSWHIQENQILKFGHCCCCC